MGHQRHDQGHKKRLARMARTRARLERSDPFELARELVRAGKCSPAVLGHNTPTDKYRKDRP